MPTHHPVLRGEGGAEVRRPHATLGREEVEGSRTPFSRREEGKGVGGDGEGRLNSDGRGRIQPLPSMEYKAHKGSQGTSVLSTHRGIEPSPIGSQALTSPSTSPLH